MKLTSRSIEAARIVATRVRAKVGKRLPQPVDDSGSTPALWSDCTGWVVDDGVDLTPDDQDLIDAIAAAPQKLSASDNSAAKVKAKLAVEIAKAKADREGGGGKRKAER